MNLSSGFPNIVAAPSCILVGGESLVQQCGALLRAAGWDIAAVFTDAPRVRAWCVEQTIPVWSVDELDAQTRDLTFDWLFSITHLRIIPGAVLARARQGGVNFHDGPLPRYGGLNAAVWALVDGQETHGISWHRMTEAVDAGAVLVQREFPIEPTDSALSINARCWEAAVDSFPELLARLAAGVEPGTVAPLDAATFHQRFDRPTGHGQLTPNATAKQWLGLLAAADTGRYANPFVSAWLAVGTTALLAQRGTSLSLTEPQWRLPEGAVLSATLDTLTVRVADGAVRLDGLRTLRGAPCDVPALLAAQQIAIGGVLPVADAHAIPQRDAAVRRTLRHEAHWVSQLEQGSPLALPLSSLDAARTLGAPDPESHYTGTVTLEQLVGGRWSGRHCLAHVALFLCRQARTDAGVVWVSTPQLADQALAGAPLLSAMVPWHLTAAHDEAASDAVRRTLQSLDEVERAGVFQHTIVHRYPSLAARMSSGALPDIAVCTGPAPRDDAATLSVHIADDGHTLTWRARSGSGWHSDDLARLHERLVAFLEALSQRPDQRVADLPLAAQAEWQQVSQWGTGTVAPASVPDTVHAQILRQADLTPDRTAVTAAGVSVSYAELVRRSGVLAAKLVQRGVAPDSRVALCCTRSVDLMVGLLAILRAGGAYVPLDPGYPADRRRMMLEDSGATVVVTQHALAELFPEHTASLLFVDDDHEVAASTLPVVAGEHLAYVIYTSGSTGRPKGVMVEHQQVVNFFHGMDTVLGTAPGVWLAVTSISFDISVLELCWTLARGYSVIIAGERRPSLPASPARRPVGFSLFYFSADEQEQASDKYRLLLDGARFADAHGFEAVWTPERHFHAFGGLYPNPSVTSAAIAAITQRVGIRAGSCVLPIHHPARVAEEWSVVDNLSNGRVGISFAAGWQPNDFVFRPENYADAKQTMFRDIAVVQRLWRGDTVAFPGPRGTVEVRTLPRPVQRELPVWITTAGNPETFAQAGRFGGNLLTHLLGQTVEELAPKIAAYRAAWREAGHPGEGRVSLMLHTFIGENDEQVREIVRGPMTEYLRTSVNLIKQYAGVFPTLRQRPGSDGSDLDFASLTPEEMDALLAFSFERYYTTSALFGTEETALAMVDKVRAIGVDEMACLVDFGLDATTVLAHLPHLNALRLRTVALSAPAASDSAASDEPTLAELVARHGVTHLQCTPSMARLLLAAPDSREALTQLSVMCVGGEALSESLAADLLQQLPGSLYNMYGPTETTIWSSVHKVVAGTGPVPLGQPLVNTTLQVVDPHSREPLPIGMPGELLIGGRGVVRGYLDRPELTAERFLTVRQTDGTSSRVYCTGDLVQWSVNGTLRFLGRLDHQVKVRGYRIELGEIEAAIARDPAVLEVAVIAREDVPGDPRLVAYVSPRPGMSPSITAIRSRLQQTLPEYMVPSHFVALADLPRTPNLKIDRKALPAPFSAPTREQQDARVRTGGDAPTAVATDMPPAATEIARTIAAVWCDVLRVPQVGGRDNFFDLGGHSLLVVQVHQRLTAALQRTFPVTDVFRFPTVESLAAHLAPRDVVPNTPPARDDIAQRAAMRRASAQQRSKFRS